MGPFGGMDGGMGVGTGMHPDIGAMHPDIGMHPGGMGMGGAGRM
jgi:hypothetical protein